MKTRKRREKLQAIAEFRAEARKRAAEIIPLQIHFLSGALEIGRDLEPAGPMAGFRG
ncbi:hypothetical protein [Pseudomonas sp. W2-17]|uniref:hypothetical protein n=1 Tax=Pseudomonas sp. W2-17 TaxID=3058039 RepID=UPI0034E0853F